MESDIHSVAGSDGVSVHTGFPNPALDNRGRQALALDLNQFLIRQPHSTYLFRISGHNWASQGVFDGDVAVIDRALPPRGSDLVVSWQHDSFMVCRQRSLPEGCETWGVVTALIHRLERQ